MLLINTFFHDILRSNGETIPLGISKKKMLPHFIFLNARQLLCSKRTSKYSRKLSKVLTFVVGFHVLLEGF
jgi:hypothetical protein